MVNNNLGNFTTSLIDQMGDPSCDILTGMMFGQMDLMQMLIILMILGFISKQLNKLIDFLIKKLLVFIKRLKHGKG